VYVLLRLLSANGRAQLKAQLQAQLSRALVWSSTLLCFVYLRQSFTLGDTWTSRVSRRCAAAAVTTVNAAVAVDYIAEVLLFLLYACSMHAAAIALLLHDAAATTPCCIPTLTQFLPVANMAFF
jgi:hypothetical protein